MSGSPTDPYKTPQTPPADSSGHLLRRPWLASLLNFVVPGLGYLYLGWWKAALALLPLTLLLMIAMGRSGAVFLPHGAVLLIGVSVLLRIGVASHAWLAASRAHPAPRLPCQRVYWYVGFAVLSVGLYSLGSFYRATVAGFDVYSIPNSAMAPTVLPGDRVMVDTTAYRDRVPERSDVVVFRYPPDPATPFIKRVVGVPADTIEVRRGVVLINGVPIPSRNLGRWSAPPGIDRSFDLVEQTLGRVTYRVLHAPGAPKRDFPIVEVGVNELYVLGDNRDNSQDSRYWGMLPIDHLIGRMRIPAAASND